MNKAYYLFIMLFISNLISAQVKFKKGYYIDNEGKKTNCFIKNNDWKHNPIAFSYQLEENNSTLSSKTIDEVKEFGIDGIVKFVRETLPIDQSSQNFQNLTISSAPDFKTETVFLKVLVEGNSNLYYYENEYFSLYFYSVNGKIEQLIFKKYKNQNGDNAFNEQYKRQLFTTFICSPDDKNKIEKLSYNNDLITYFIETNNCKSPKEQTTQTTSEVKDFEINFKPNVLLNAVSPKIEISKNAFENKNTLTNLSFGFESEIILPYRNKNWSVILDPSFTSFKDEFLMKFEALNVNAKTKNFIFRLPIGIRRYFHINDRNAIFINASVACNFEKSDVTIDSQTYKSHITAFNIPIGLGYRFDKYNLELKYFSNTSLAKDVFPIDANYKFSQISLKFGYQLF